jgi:hypothetical protein
MKTTTSAFAVFLLAMLAAQQLLADISCPEVVNDLTPCLGYLQGREASPSAACCGGAKALYGAADTRDERQQTCQCLKVAYHQYNVIVSAAQALPAACGLGLSYAITPDIDCSTWVTSLIPTHAGSHRLLILTNELIILFLLLLQDPLNEGTTRFLTTDVDDDAWVLCFFS